MSQFLIALSVWLHALGTVILIGHYLLLALIYLPALHKTQTNISGPILSEISKRSRPWMYASLLIFIVTGTYLMLIDPGYLGFMDFGNLWGILMLVKHILVLGMIAIGFWFNAMGPGHRTAPHHHDENDELLSAVYYIRVPENSGDLILHTAGKSISIHPQEGKLVLFAPALLHEVTTNLSAELRLSVAVNIGPVEGY